MKFLNVMPLLQEGPSFPGLRVGSCLTLRNELSKETRELTKKRFYWEDVPRQRPVGWGNPGELLRHTAHSLGLYGDGVSFRVVSDQSFWLRVLPGGAHIAQPRWMPARRILWGGRTCGVAFWPFPNTSSWWWLISSVLVTRTSCHKTTHTNGYYGAWPGQAVSVSVLLLTTAPWEISYSRCFLELGIEVPFCNFFLLCLGVILPSRAEVSLYLIQVKVFTLKPACTLLVIAI